MNITPRSTFLVISFPVNSSLKNYYTFREKVESLKNSSSGKEWIVGNRSLLISNQN